MAQVPPLKRQDFDVDVEARIQQKIKAGEQPPPLDPVVLDKALLDPLEEDTLQVEAQERVR